MMSGQDLYKVFMCALLVSFCSHTVFGRPNKRDVDQFSLGPCGEIENALTQTSSLSFEEELGKLKARAAGLELQATALNDHILSEHSIHFTSDVIRILDLKEFMNKTAMQNLESDTEPKVDALKMHYAMVEEHIQYVHDTRTSGNFSTLASTQNTADLLLKYETYLISFACSISIAVIAAEGELPVATDVELVELFDYLGSNHQYQVFRAYLTSRDGMLLMSHLQVAYDQM